MTTAIVVQAPDDVVDRLRRGAAAARKPLDQFVIERLQEATLPPLSDLPPPLGDDLRRLEQLDDGALWEVARSTLAPTHQRRYDRLLRAQSRAGLTPAQQRALQRLGDDARHRTLLKAHALLLLKWRGHPLPAPERLLSEQ